MTAPNQKPTKNEISATQESATVTATIKTPEEEIEDLTTAIKVGIKNYLAARGVPPHNANKDAKEKAMAVKPQGPRIFFFSASGSKGIERAKALLHMLEENEMKTQANDQNDSQIKQQQRIQHIIKLYACLQALTNSSSAWLSACVTAAITDKVVSIPIATTPSSGMEYVISPKSPITALLDYFHQRLETAQRRTARIQALKLFAEKRVPTETAETPLLSSNL